MCEDLSVRVFSILRTQHVQTLRGHDSPVHAIYR